MKRLCEEANIPATRNYTNHSIRATCISHLDTCGFEAHHITTISSHKSESTIKEYAIRCPDNKRKEMFTALATTMHQPKKIKKEVTSTVTSENAAVPQVSYQNNNPQINFDEIVQGDLIELNADDDKLFV